MLHICNVSHPKTRIGITVTQIMSLKDSIYFGKAHKIIPQRLINMLAILTSVSNK